MLTVATDTIREAILGPMPTKEQILDKIEGGVFTKGFVDNWIEYKLANEVEPANLRISPYEFYLYFDV